MLCVIPEELDCPPLFHFHFLSYLGSDPIFVRFLLSRQKVSDVTHLRESRPGSVKTEEKAEKGEQNE